jgi:spore maturation protein CgeB
MKILYASGLSQNDSSLYRLWALERLGHTVIPFNAFEYESRNPFIRKAAFRLSAGLGVQRLNRDLLRIAEAEKPEVFWADKLLWLQPGTIDKLRSIGIYTLSYMIDNAFGPRRDPGFRLYMKCIPHYDLHVVQRDKNISDYRERGARATSSRYKQPMNQPSTPLLQKAGRMQTGIATSPLSGLRTTSEPHS